MSESDLYRKQKVAVENVARTIAMMERTAMIENEEAIEEPIVNEPSPIPG
jgi:hypothetical protein